MFLPCKKCVPKARQGLPLCDVCIKAKEFHDLELFQIREENREFAPMTAAQIPEENQGVFAPWLEYEIVARSAPLAERATNTLACGLADALDILQGAQVPEKAELFRKDMARFVRGRTWEILRDLPLCPSGTGRDDGDLEDREQFSEIIGAIGRAYKLANDLGALPAPKENPKLPAPLGRAATFAEREFRRVFSLADKALADLHNCPKGSRRHRRAVRLVQKPEFAAWIAMLQEIVQSLHGVAPLSAVDPAAGIGETRRASAFAGEQRRQRESADRRYIDDRRRAPCVTLKASIAMASGGNGRAEYARLDAKSRAKLADWRAGAK